MKPIDLNRRLAEAQVARQKKRLVVSKILSKPKKK